MRLAFGRRGATGRLGAFLGIFALLLQLGVPLAHDPLGGGLATPLLGAPLCHAGASGTGGHAPLPASPDKGALCPICLGLAAASSAVVPPDPGRNLLIATLPVVPPSARPAEAQPISAFHHAAQPRAPPVLV